MTRRRHILPVLAILITLAACRPGPVQPGRNGAGTEGAGVFDLKRYTDSLVDHYTEKGFEVRKRVSLNDRSEEVERLKVDWKVEFGPIIDAHINRSAWLDKFSTDTLERESGSSVLYHTRNAGIPVKELEVRYGPEGDVEHIRLKTSRKNILYTSNQEIGLTPGVAYTVEGWQRTLFLSKTTFRVEAEILRNDGE